MVRSILVVWFCALFALACSAGKDDTGGTTPRDSSTAATDSTTGDETSDDTGAIEDGTTPPDSTVTIGDSAVPGDSAFPTFDTAPADTYVAPTLSIIPADGTVIIPTGATTTTVDYYARYTDSSGVGSIVTATWSIDDATIGTFAGSTLTAKKIGKTNVRATAMGLMASTSITVSGPVSIVTPSAPSDAPTKFGGAVDATRAPTWVYPSNGTLVPPNMNTLEFHYMPGSGNTIFELAFLGTGVDLKVYFKCDPVGGGCIYAPDATVWKYLAEGGRGKAPVTYTLRGTDGSKVGVSASQTISFGQENIVGGIYYWNAKAGATMRYEFGVTGKSAEVYMNAAKAGATTCVGCHVVSRDGTRIAIGLDIPAPSPYKVFDVASKLMIYAQGTSFGGGSNFFSFSPDSKQIMTSNGVSIVLRNAATGAAITDPLVAKGAHPDWAPNGVKMVYASPATAPPCVGFCGSTGVDSASLQTLTYSGGAWSKTPATLVAFGGQNNFYPTFSPDGKWVLFNRSPSNANSYDAKDAQVWVVSEAGGTPVRLATASTGGDSWPKWAPAIQAYKGGQLMWLTFSSRRAYGLRLAKDAQVQLWMVAFDPSKASTDPSGPAFWLPFQDMGSGNHIAQWVTNVARQPCGPTTMCEASEICYGGRCVPK
jgi:hypothetical protein